VLAVICLLLALLVGIAAYLHHFEPQVVGRLDEGLKSASAYVTQLFQPPAAAQRPSVVKPVEPKRAKPSKLFTAEELSQHDGTDPNKPILLGILGALPPPQQSLPQSTRPSCVVVDHARHTCSRAAARAPPRQGL
jgi:hypothetical protein